MIVDAAINWADRTKLDTIVRKLHKFLRLVYVCVNSTLGGLSATDFATSSHIDADKEGHLQNTQGISEAKCCLYRKKIDILPGIPNYHYQRIA